MEKYLIAVDLDGTLIPNLYDISEYTVKVFNKIRELGHKIVIVTGRPFRSSYFVYQLFHLDTPIINYNGQLITNPSDPNYAEKSWVMKREDVLKIYNFSKDKQFAFFTENYDNICSNNGEEYLHKLMHLKDLSKLYVGDLNEILKTDIHGSLILAKDEYGSEIVNYVNNNFTDIKARTWKWDMYNVIVELYSTLTNKGTSIKIVRDELGFDKAHTISLGDSKNDFEVFNEAAIKIAPLNAEEEIRKIATYVTDETCEKDGIAKFLVKYFNIEI
mgnify:CR=1 FL=1